MNTNKIDFNIRDISITPIKLNPIIIKPIKLDFPNINNIIEKHNCQVCKKNISTNLLINSATNIKIWICSECYSKLNPEVHHGF